MSKDRDVHGAFTGEVFFLLTRILFLVKILRKRINVGINRRVKGATSIVNDPNRYR